MDQPRGVKEEGQADPTAAAQEPDGQSAREFVKMPIGSLRPRMRVILTWPTDAKTIGIYPVRYVVKSVRADGKVILKAERKYTK